MRADSAPRARVHCECSDSATTQSCVTARTTAGPPAIIPRTGAQGKAEPIRRLDPPVSARTSARRTPRNDRAASAASAPGRARAARPRGAPSAPDGRCSARPGNRVRRPRAWRPERQRRIQDTSDSHTCCAVYPRSGASLRPERPSPPGLPRQSGTPTWGPAPDRCTHARRRAASLTNDARRERFAVARTRHGRQWRLCVATASDNEGGRPDASEPAAPNPRNRQSPAGGSTRGPLLPRTRSRSAADAAASHGTR